MDRAPQRLASGPVRRHASALQHRSDHGAPLLGDERAPRAHVWPPPPHLETALQRVKPSALRESLMADPGIRWDDVGREFHSGVAHLRNSY